MISGKQSIILLNKSDLDMIVKEEDVKNAYFAGNLAKSVAGTILRPKPFSIYTIEFIIVLKNSAYLIYYLIFLIFYPYYHQFFLFLYLQLESTSLLNLLGILCDCVRC